MLTEFEVTPILDITGSPEISLTRIYLKGINSGNINKNTTAVYVCVDGEITFIVGSVGSHTITKLMPGDRIKIDPGISYFDFSPKGATVLAINKTAYDKDNTIPLNVPEELLQIARTKTLLT